jgi:hypothetical protein
VARSLAAAASPIDSEQRQIVAWYEDLLERTTPPLGLAWEPVKIGPTWQWTESGWLLPARTLGWGVLAWCGTWLQDGKGHPWQFTPEQARFILWFYALDESGDFLYHSAVLQRLKGWGKDPLLACLSAASCFADVSFGHWDGDRPIGREEPNAYVQLVAVSLDQAKRNTMTLFPSLISPEARRQYGIQVGKEDVWGLGDTRHIQAVASSVMAIEGPRPTLVGRNETQNWNASNGGHDLAGAIEGNVAKSPGAAARILDVCNAYRPGEDSVAERTREGWEATQGDDPRALDYGLLYDSLEAPPEAPLSPQDAPDVVRSIAGDASWLDTRPNGRIVKSILNPSNSASESRRKWYNQITATEDAWLTPQEFDACKAGDDVEPVEPGQRMFLFFDGSKSDDATAVIGCRESDGHVFTVGVWQKPPRARKEWTVDRDIVDRRVRDWLDEHDVIGLWADPSDARDDETGERFWEPILDGWAKDYGDSFELPAVKSGPRKHAVIWDMRNPANVQTFTEHAERFTSDVTDRRLTHDGGALLVQHVRNARRRPGKYGVSLGKEHRESPRKIDAAVCAVGARMMRHIAAQSDTKKKRSGRVW